MKAGEGDQRNPNCFCFVAWLLELVVSCGWLLKLVVM
jgi:hypothetical protein